MKNFEIKPPVALECTKFVRVLKIRQKRNEFFKPTFPPKNERKNIKSLGKAEVFFISVASPVFSENPPKFHQKSQIYRTPLTGGLAKRSAKIKITPIPNSSLIPCFDMSKIDITNTRGSRKLASRLSVLRYYDYVIFRNF